MPMARMSAAVSPALAMASLRGGQLRGPNLHRVVLDPELRKVLRQLALRHRDDAALRIEDDAARAGGASGPARMWLILSLRTSIGQFNRHSRAGAGAPSQRPAMDLMKSMASLAISALSLSIVATWYEFSSQAISTRLAPTLAAISGPLVG